MSSTIMLFNGPNGVWTADPLEFMAAAREQWPEAVVADDPDSGGYHLVGIQFVSPPAGIGADGSFAISPEGAGYFSIRSGVDRACGRDVRLGPRLARPQERVRHRRVRKRRGGRGPVRHRRRPDARAHRSRQPIVRWP